MDQGLTLAGARVALDAARADHFDIGIRNGSVSLGGKLHGPQIDLRGYLVLPGLINAHDHLEFNLFPRLGNGPYANAAEWAADIYRPGEPPVRDLLQIPKQQRLFWGAIKNLASGVTTVSNHNPYEPGIFGDEFPVRVVRRFGWAHSLDFSPDLSDRFHATPHNWPFIIHAAEGIDARARQEFARLDALGVLAGRSVLVHGVAADDASVALLETRRASLVWCPSSNLFLFGRTLDPNLLRSDVPIALGTDSTLTGEGDMLDELRVARENGAADADRLYRMVTTVAARILRLNRGEGSITNGGPADLLAVADRGQTPADALLDLRPPEMVVVGGRIRLLSGSLAARAGLPECADWSRLEIEGRGSWLTPLELQPVPALNGDLRIAGRKVRL